MFHLKYPLFLLFLSCFACKSSDYLNNFDWLEGKWQINESASFEEWTKIDDTLYRGKGYEIRKNDTLITEMIEIVQKGKEVFYIPSVADQNNGQPVEFKLISKKKGIIIFENKNHDFPQRIIYVKNGKDQIDAKIEGEKKGVFSEIKFTLKRVN